MTRPKVHFGQVLREARLAKGYSLRKFAEKVGISPTYLSLVEQGKVESQPTAERFSVSAEAMRIRLEELKLLVKEKPQTLF